MVAKEYKDVKKEEKFDRNVERMEEIHNKYHPKVIFLTQALAAGSGFFMKNVWKKAYPNEDIKFSMIDVGYRRERNLKERGKSFRKSVDKIKKKLRSYDIEGNALVVDEVTTADPPKEWRTSKLHVPRCEDDCFDMFEVKNFDPLVEKLDNKKRKIHASYLASAIVKKAYEELSKENKVGVVIFDPFFPVQSALRTSPHIRYDKDTKEGAKYLGQAGREVGEEILKRSKRNNLEKRVSGTLAIIGLGGGLLFFPRGITGNAINFLQRENAFSIGIILFILGVVAGFFFLKKTK